MVKRPGRQRAEAGQGDGWQRAGEYDPARAEVRGTVFVYKIFCRRRDMMTGAGRGPGNVFVYKIFLQRGRGTRATALDM